MKRTTDFVLIGGPSSEVLAKKIAQKLGIKYLKTGLKIFQDGEQKITIKYSFQPEKIIIVQSTSPPVDSTIFQLMCLISKAKDICSEIIVVIPYFGYAKQDKEFLKGEIISLKVISQLLESIGISKLIVVDFHSNDGLDFFHVPVKNVTALPALANYLQKFRFKDPLVVSPDLFWKTKAEELAIILNTKSISLNKRRNRKTGSLQIFSKKPKLKKGGDLIILDDMISTGGSVIKAIKFLGRKNFRKIFIVCTHPVLVDKTEKKLAKLHKTEIIGTNSIEGNFSKVDISGIISQEILRW